jgi:hypothetical protein
VLIVEQAKEEDIIPAKNREDLERIDKEQRLKPRPKLIFCNSKIERLFGCDRPMLKLGKLEMLELDPFG